MTCPLAGCGKKANAVAADPLRAAYDSEADWNDPQRVIPLNYQQAQGKRVFYAQCVWCHADATPAGPSNRSNLMPMPVLMNDGAALNGQSDEYLREHHHAGRQRAVEVGDDAALRQNVDAGRDRGRHCIRARDCAARLPAAGAAGVEL